MAIEIVPQDTTWRRQAERNLTALYENRPEELDHMPFEFEAYTIRDRYDIMPSDGAMRTASDRSAEDARRDFCDAEKALSQQLEAITVRQRKGFPDDRVFSVIPALGATGWFAEFFGCPTEWFTCNRPPYPHPIAFDVKQMAALTFDRSKGDLYRVIRAQIEYFTSTLRGRIPVAAPDLQSPVDIASMIMDYTQLIYAMMDAPDQVHAFMRMLTETMIEIYGEIAAMLDGYPLTHNYWIPRGIFLSDDLQATLSPDLYDEFARPYNEMLGEAFNGVALHTCGQAIQMTPIVLKTRNLLFTNISDPIAQLAPLVHNRTVISGYGSYGYPSPGHPKCNRRNMNTPEEVEAFWFEDMERLPEIHGQRFIYHCHALLAHRRSEDAYARMQAVSRLSMASLALKYREVDAQ